jgi:hypothetical protein
VTVRWSSMRWTGRTKPCSTAASKNWTNGSQNPSTSSRTTGFACSPSCPCQCLGQLVERAEAARQDDEPRRQRGHQRLALVHRADDVERRQPPVGHLRLLEELRDDAGDLASGVEHGVGHHAHESDVAATAHQADAPAGQRVTEPRRRVREPRRLPGVGPAEHAQPQHGREPCPAREPWARPHRHRGVRSRSPRRAARRRLADHSREFRNGSPRDVSPQAQDAANGCWTAGHEVATAR